MRVTIVAKLSGHQNQHAVALDRGLKAIGVEVQRQTTFAPVTTDVVACWGWRTGQRYRELGHDVLVMERGYLGDRFTWTSIGWNGLNGKAEFAPAPNDGGERFRRNFRELMQPWRSGGECALLIGQVPGDASLAGRNLAPWYAEQARQARARFGLPVIFRPHPLAYRRGGVRAVPGTELREGPLAPELERAAVVITFNSNTAVESVLAGVPTICTDRGSMAWEMASHSITEPLVTPDREQWAATLAWRQWRLDEIESGFAIQQSFAAVRRVA